MTFIWAGDVHLWYVLFLIFNAWLNQRKNRVECWNIRYLSKLKEKTVWTFTFSLTAFSTSSTSVNALWLYMAYVSVCVPWFCSHFATEKNWLDFHFYQFLFHSILASDNFFLDIFGFLLRSYRNAWWSNAKWPRPTEVAFISCALKRKSSFQTLNMNYSLMAKSMVQVFEAADIRSHPTNRVDYLKFQLCMIFIADTSATGIFSRLLRGTLNYSISV